MKVIRFLLFLIRNGTLKSTRYDFEAERRKVVSTFGRNVPQKPATFTSLGNNQIVSSLSYLKNAGKMNMMFHVVDSKKMVYVRILKCASTSILKVILPEQSSVSKKNLSDEEIDALSFYYGKNKLSSVEKEYAAFAVVRNPFSRLVSVYRDLFNPDRAFTYGNYWFGILKPGMTFHEFVNTISKIPKLLLGPHFSPQSTILSGTKLRHLRILKLDKDADELKSFMTANGWNLEKRNSSGTQSELAEFYTAATLEKAFQLYKEDVHAFDYHEEYERLKINCT